jgi:hypothetical protein
MSLAGLVDILAMPIGFAAFMSWRIRDHELD